MHFTGEKPPAQFSSSDKTTNGDATTTSFSIKSCKPSRSKNQRSKKFVNALIMTWNDFESDLLDLSQPMLSRAHERLAIVNQGTIATIQADIHDAQLDDESYDVVLAAAVLHHLRDDQDWETAFAKLFRIVAPGGSVWITDLVSHETEGVHAMMWHRYGEYLMGLGGADYRENVFAYIAREDSPRAVTYQLDLLRKSGFHSIELLHENSCFAAFGALKS